MELSAGIRVESWERTHIRPLQHGKGKGYFRRPEKPLLESVGYCERLDLPEGAIYSVVKHIVRKLAPPAP